ncbi:MAG: hypothetical protein ACXVAJ_06835 [Parachlamydiaceae bacterium]
MKAITEEKSQPSNLLGIVRNFVFANRKTGTLSEKIPADKTSWNSYEVSKAGLAFYAEAEIRRSEAVRESRRLGFR